jgi:hypothetical protein
MNSTPDRQLKVLLKSLVPMLLSILVAQSAVAGPWTRSTGEFYVQTGERLFLADSYVDNRGALVNNVDYVGASTYLYMEAGIASQLQVHGYLPYIVAINSFIDDWRYMRGGLGDGLLGMQWAPFDDILLALRLDAKIPLYDLNNYEGPYTLNFPALGSGQVDFTWWMSYGGNLPNRPLYIFAELGFRQRTGLYVGEGIDSPPDYGNSIPFNFQMGINRWAHFIPTLNIGGTIPFKDDGVTDGFVTLTEGAYIPLKGGFALVLGIDEIAWARNSALGYGFNLGFAYAR